MGPSEIDAVSAPDARWCGRLRGRYMLKGKFPSEGVVVRPLWAVGNRILAAEDSETDSGAPKDVRSPRL